VISDDQRRKPGATGRGSVVTESEIPLPNAPALRVECERWPWFPQQWEEQEPASRDDYDRWVTTARTERSAQRRAALVVRRVWVGRPYAGPLRRRWDALVDFFFPDPPPESVNAADGGGSGPAGWWPGM
jgi:hypothetical protein